MKIAIVDDSQADRNLCRILLREAYGDAVECLEAANAEQGLGLCRTAHPACVVVDYKLPDMTGLDFLAKLNDQEFRPAVVVLTGLDSGEVAAAALRAGAHDFLLKDHINGETLHLAIEKAIQKLDLIRMLKEERDRLATSLAEKEVLLKEVHHRVKNNLQIIVSLLRMQTAAICDGHVAQALTESQHRVEAMALVHEQLYESTDFRGVDLARHANVLMANLRDAYGVDPSRIHCEVTVEPMPLGVDQAIPVGLILTELISNALNHAFPVGRSGRLRIRCSRAGGRILIEVADDGVGIPEGAEPARAKSLGLKIVGILSKQLKGTFSWSRGNPGATFLVSFPEQAVLAENAAQATAAAAPES